VWELDFRERRLAEVRRNCPATRLGAEALSTLTSLFLDEQGVGLYTHPSSDALYNIVDVTAKVVYGFIFLGGILGIEKRAANAMGRSPKDMDEEEYLRFTSELIRHEGAESRHKLAALSAGFGEAAQERGSTDPSGGQTTSEAEPEEMRVVGEEDDDVRRPPTDGKICE
jgi:hypothetical protein